VFNFCTYLFQQTLLIRKLNRTLYPKQIVLRLLKNICFSQCSVVFQVPLYFVKNSEAEFFKIFLEQILSTEAQKPTEWWKQLLNLWKCLMSEKWQKMLYKGNDTNDIVPSCSKKKSSLMFSPMKKYYHEIIP